MRRSRAFGEVLDVMAEVKRRGNRGFRERERERKRGVCRLLNSVRWGVECYNYVIVLYVLLSCSVE